MAQQEVSQLLNKNFHQLLLDFDDKAQDTLVGIVGQQDALIQKLEAMQNQLSMSQDVRGAMEDVVKRVGAVRRRADKLYQDLLKLNTKINEQNLQADVKAKLQPAPQPVAPVDALLDL